MSNAELHRLLSDWLKQPAYSVDLLDRTLAAMRALKHKT